MLYVNIYVVFHRKKIGTVKLIILFKIKDFYRLVIDKKERNVSLADLKGTLEVFVRKIANKNDVKKDKKSFLSYNKSSQYIKILKLNRGKI